MPKVENNSEQKVKTVDVAGTQYNKQKEQALKKFDILKMYRRKPYHVNDKITIYQPTLGQIIEFGDKKQYGEREFYSTINIFVSNPTSYRLQLWDMGLDWNKLSDFELFAMLCSGIHPDVQKILFGEKTNLRNLKPYVVENKMGETDGYDENNKDNSDPVEAAKELNKIILFDKDTGLEIDEETYTLIAQYMRVMFNIFPKVEKAKGKTTKEWIIEEERDKLKRQANKSTSSMLLPLISACLNHPGFKYKADELENVGIVEFMDAVQRLQIYENTRALLTGSYSGMISSKDIPKEELNFMRDYVR